MPEDNFIKFHLGGNTVIYVGHESSVYDYEVNDGVITIYNAPYSEDDGVITIE